MLVCRFVFQTWRNRLLLCIILVQIILISHLNIACSNRLLLFAPRIFTTTPRAKQPAREQTAVVHGLTSATACFWATIDRSEAALQRHGRWGATLWSFVIINFCCLFMIITAITCATPAISPNWLVTLQLCVVTCWIVINARCILGRTEGSSLLLDQVVGRLYQAHVFVGGLLKGVGERRIQSWVVFCDRVEVVEIVGGGCLKKAEFSVLLLRCVLLKVNFIDFLFYRLWLWFSLQK